MSSRSRVIAFSHFNISCYPPTVRMTPLQASTRAKRSRRLCSGRTLSSGNINAIADGYSNKRHRRNVKEIVHTISPSTHPLTTTASVITATGPEYDAGNSLSQSNQNSDGDEILRAEKQMSERLSLLKFTSPVTHVYNPLVYAWAGHEW